MIYPTKTFNINGAFCVPTFFLLYLHRSLSWSLGSIFCRNSITFAGSGGPVMSMKCCMATTHGAPSTSAQGRQRLNVAEFRSRDLSKTSRPKCRPNTSPLLVQVWYFVTRSVRWKVGAPEKYRFFLNDDQQAESSGKLQQSQTLKSRNIPTIGS